MLRFDDEVKRVLESAGWSESRKVSADEWVSALTAEGYTFFPLVLEVLENLGGLTVVPPVDQNDRARAFCPSPFHFDPMTGLGEFDRFNTWQEEFGLKLFPLGEVGWYFLMVASNGRVFAGADGNFELLGQTIESALATLIFARTRPIPWM
jgi:hypothetical protein